MNASTHIIIRTPSIKENKYSLSLTATSSETLICRERIDIDIQRRSRICHPNQWPRVPSCSAHYDARARRTRRRESSQTHTYASHVCIPRARVCANARIDVEACVFVAVVVTRRINCRHRVASRSHTRVVVDNVARECARRSYAATFTRGGRLARGASSDGDTGDNR